jgi:hypothetical protein
MQRLVRSVDKSDSGIEHSNRLLAIPPVDTCVFPRLLWLGCYALSEVCPYIRHLDLLLSPTLPHCRLLPHPNFKSLRTRDAVLGSLSILQGRNVRSMHATHCLMKNAKGFP